MFLYGIEEYKSSLRGDVVLRKGHEILS